MRIEKSWSDVEGESKLGSKTWFQVEVTDHCIQKPVQTPIPTPIPTPRRTGSIARPSAGRKPEPVGLARELEPSGPADRTYKVVFAGDAAVGKTSFINRLTKGKAFT